MNSAPIRIIMLTSIALLAFAGNSVLCRLALQGQLIDAASFTIIRLLSGVVILLSIVAFINRSQNKREEEATKESTKESREQTVTFQIGRWLPAFFLFTYALTFSYAYINLDTGTGALILFGAVQLTMVLFSLFSGNKLHLFEWVGLALAFSGFVYLNLPSVNQPPLIAFLLMIIAGVSWGIYSLLGRTSKNPIADTSQNFLKTLPFIGILCLLMVTNIDVVEQIQITKEGVLLAIISGAVMSGIGYVIWYMALGGLSITQAAVAQLLVPILSTFGGVLLLSESITLRLTVATLLIVGGIFIVLLAKKYKQVN